MARKERVLEYGLYLEWFLDAGGLKKMPFLTLLRDVYLCMNLNVRERLLLVAREAEYAHSFCFDEVEFH